MKKILFGCSIFLEKKEGVVYETMGWDVGYSFFGFFLCFSSST
ncbi:hypothetical protein BREVNS_1492 [Brevinematales bacterium NS]|nr:hypothetical protein BREVNS_1492 [Brevinematales bacterium NS]